MSYGTEIILGVLVAVIVGLIIGVNKIYDNWLKSMMYGKRNRKV